MLAGYFIAMMILMEHVILATSRLPALVTHLRLPFLLQAIIPFLARMAAPAAGLVVSKVFQCQIVSHRATVAMVSVKEQHATRQR
jgi:hypothetical protein